VPQNKFRVGSSRETAIRFEITRNGFRLRCVLVELIAGTASFVGARVSSHLYAARDAFAGDPTATSSRLQLTGVVPTIARSVGVTV